MGCVQGRLEGEESFQPQIVVLFWDGSRDLGAQELFQALCSGVTSDGAHVAICGAWDGNRQGKCLVLSLQSHRNVILCDSDVKVSIADG